MLQGVSSRLRYVATNEALLGNKDFPVDSKDVDGVPRGSTVELHGGQTKASKVSGDTKNMQEYPGGTQEALVGTQDFH